MLRATHYEPVIRFDLARTLAGKGRYWTTAYYLDGLLIDSGPAHTQFELLSFLKNLPLSQIVNTHTHEDHIGANGLLQRTFRDLRIYAHPLALEVLANPREKQPLHPYRKLFWGWPDPCTAHPVQEGERITTPHYELQVLYTPGHSVDHICLYEPKQEWIFTGDLYVGGQDRGLRAGYNIWQIIASLKRLLDLPLRLMFPGSARVRTSPHTDLREKIAYLESCGERVLELYHRGVPISRIAHQVFGPTMLIEWMTLGNFSRRWLVLSYLQQNHA